MRETLTGERAVPTLRALAHYVAQSVSTELLLVERGQTAPSTPVQTRLDWWTGDGG